MDRLFLCENDMDIAFHLYGFQCAPKCTVATAKYAVGLAGCHEELLIYGVPDVLTFCLFLLGKPRDDDCPS